MTNEQLQKIDEQILNDIDTTAKMLEAELEAGALNLALDTHKRLLALEALREYTFDLDPDNDEAESVPNEALIAAKESYDQRVSSPEPLISERPLYDGTNAPAFVRMLLGF